MKLFKYLNVYGGHAKLVFRNKTGQETLSNLPTFFYQIQEVSAPRKKIGQILSWALMPSVLVPLKVL